MQNACAVLHYNVLSVCTTLFHIISQTTQFSINKYLKIKHFSNFLQILSENFIFLTRIRRRVVLHICLALCKYLLNVLEFNKIWSYSKRFVKFLIIRIFMNKFNVGRVVWCFRTDGQTAFLNLIIDFPKFA
jgi:hypothetical protein